MRALGRHILVEFFGCEPHVMNDVARIESSMVAAAEKAGATVINSTFHHFSPYGVSGVVVIQESHLAIHTWPEYGYAAVDLFTCGDSVDPWISFDHLKEAFGAGNYSALEMRRGSLALLERLDVDLASMRELNKKHTNPQKYTRNVWFTDKDDNQALSLRHTGEVFYDKTSQYQRTRVIDTYGYGKALTIDNMFMCTERDEANYHEMISHPAMLAHGHVKKVLIIGGGDGASVREIVKHPEVEKIVMVEIDANVVEASKQFLPQMSSAFNNPKLELIIGDGIQYVAQAPDKSFDYVIVDGSDPVGPAEGLFSEKFYRDCQRVLTDGGILITQGESPMFNAATFAELNACLKRIFSADRVKTMLFHIPTYPSGIWSFQLGINGPLDVTTPDPEAAQRFTQANSLKYYNPEVHRAAFALPQYVKQMLHE